MTTATLEDICRRPVRFSEIDTMRRVWHGAYVTYFEDGREAFGRRFPGIGYADMQRAGIYAPVYELRVKYIGPLALNDDAVIRTRYIYKAGARLDFEYEIRRGCDGTLCAEGNSVQLFIDGAGELLVDKPDFFAAWQRRHLPMCEREGGCP